MIILESSEMLIKFNKNNGLLCSVINKKTQENYNIFETGLIIDGMEFQCDKENMRLCGTEIEKERLLFKYECTDADIEVLWSLGLKQHFTEKQITIIPKKDYTLKRVMAASFDIEESGVELLCVKHPTFQRLDNNPKHKMSGIKREPGTEPVRTWMGRTGYGGFFTGLEMPFDKSRIEGRVIHLSFSPNLKLKKDEHFKCEPVYLGVYERNSYDTFAYNWRPNPDKGLTVEMDIFDGAAAAGLKQGELSENRDEITYKDDSEPILPLPSESKAVTEMTSEILGPPRHGLKALACGWHSEMEQGEYTEESLEGDKQSLLFIKECGLDGLTNSHPWGGY
jgi:hypothetical protein